MDVSELMTLFTNYGFETDDEMTDAAKLEALNETYWDVCDREAWPFLETALALNFTGTSGRPSNAPADLGTVLTIFRLADGVILEPWRMDDFYERFGSNFSLPGDPQLYLFEAGLLQVYPLPPVGTAVVHVKYLRVPAELTALSLEADIAIPKRHHRAVLGLGTLSRLALMQDDVDMSNAYERLYEKALALMVDSEFRQQSMRPDYIHVNDPDNWDYS